jgi:hypothetical protein
MTPKEKNLETRARRAAERAGLMAKKSRKRTWCYNDQGGFCLVEPERNIVVAGERYDFSAADVIEWCAE